MTSFSIRSFSYIRTRVVSRRTSWPINIIWSSPLRSRRKWCCSNLAECLLVIHSTGLQKIVSTCGQRLLMTNDKARSAFKIRLTSYRRRKTWSQMWQQLKEISKAESINTWSAAKFVCLPQADKDKSKFLFIDYEDLKSKRYDGLWKD